MNNLVDIVGALDAALQATPLADFYRLRKQLTGGNASSGYLLQVIRDAAAPRSGYAYHKGGRGELQFNIGFEEDGARFRFGVGFSLRPGPYRSDPLSDLATRLAYFNQIIGDFPELAHLQMSLQDSDDDATQNVGPIPLSWQQTGAFIFLGERIRVPAAGIGAAHIARVAEVLQQLLPLYLKLEEGHASAGSVARYVARLCWNDSLWQQPSGSVGKSTNPDTFEAEHGFGHEEWLFDRGMLIDGWKYGFVQSLNRAYETHKGRVISLLLYAIDGDDKTRCWVGAIDRVEVVTDAQGQHALNEYETRGWLDGMRAQVLALGFKADELDVGHHKQLFNIRFRPDALQVFDPSIPFDTTEMPGARYGNLQAVPKRYAGLLGPAIVRQALVEQSLNATKATVHYQAASIEIDLVQKQWQNELRRTLKLDLPGTDVAVEARVDGHRVDAVIGNGRRRVFIELKTRGVVRQVIRDALSQLLEYAYWPTDERCAALLIVGPVAAGPQDQAYLSLLRQRFGVPVHYLQYREGRIVGIARWYASVAPG